MRHAVDLPRDCPSCGVAAVEHCVARSSPQGLRTSGSLRCGACSHAHETDGGELDGELRSAFVRTEGEWAIAVTDLGPNPHRAMVILRASASIDFTTAMRMVRECEPFAKGASVEIEQLQLELEHCGASVTVNRL